MRSSNNKSSVELAHFIKDRVLKEGAVGKHPPSEIARALMNMLSAWLESGQDESLLVEKIKVERETLGLDLADIATGIIDKIAAEADRLGLDTEDKSTNWLPIAVDQLVHLIHQESRRELS